jgi:hypothetical protein
MSVTGSTTSDSLLAQLRTEQCSKSGVGDLAEGAGRPRNFQTADAFERKSNGKTLFADQMALKVGLAAASLLLVSN